MSKYFLIFILLFTFVNSFAQKNKTKQTLYMYGISNDLNDSIYYFIPVQNIKSPSFNPKSKLLNNRSDYSQQIENYIQGLYGGHQTCAIFYGKNLQRIEKQFKKLYHRYTQKYGKNVNILESFQFAQ